MQQLAAGTGHRQNSSYPAAETTESSTVRGALNVLGAARRLGWGKGKGGGVMERWNVFENGTGSTSQHCRQPRVQWVPAAQSSTMVK